MSRITLKHLRYFEALARHRHFGHAAEALSISQPALSLQMKELEEILGAPLVEPWPRHIRLTGLGEEVAQRARDILRGVDEVASLAKASSWPLSGRLRLGIIPTIAPYLLPRVVSQLAARFPDLSLHPREAVTAKLVRDLAEGRLDLAMVALPVSEPGLAEHPLFDEGFLSTLVQKVAAGLGVTNIPEMAAAIEGRSAPVLVQRLADRPPSRTVGLVWRQSDPLADRYAELARGLREAFA